MSAGAYVVDGRPASAQVFYAAACDPQCSAVVEACAGAGKTWMLVSRILRALLEGADPAQILAITFTRKAAGEMRQRLDEWLLGLSAARADDEQRVQELMARGLERGRAVQLAPALGALHERVLEGTHRVEIRTFHAWFGQLLAQAPLQVLETLGLAPDLQLVEDPAPLRGALMRRFHQALQQDPDRRDDYVTLVRRHRRFKVQSWLEAAWQRRTEIETAASAGTLDGGVPPAWRVYAELTEGVHPLAAMRDPLWRGELQRLAALLAARAKTVSDTAAEGLAAALACSDDRAAFDKAWSALFTDKGEPRRRMGDLPAQTAACERLLALRDRLQQQDAHDDHRRMVRLSGLLLAQYDQLKRSRALADMADLERVALQLLSDDALAGWMQTRLGVRLRHLLIDEFQDTSPLQWHALYGWLSGYAGAGGGQPLSVFIVGDPKQSIYRFRRAEPRVFAAARDFVRDGLAGRVLACDHTRRNAPGIVDAVNAVFERARTLDGWDGFRAHTTAAEGSGALLCLPDVVAEEKPASSAGKGWRDSLTEPRIEPEDARGLPEARQVAAAIAERVAGGVGPGDVMVLARTRAPLVLVAQALDERQLPFTEPEALQVATSPEALDLMALLDVLASPGHDLSLARALKSPIFSAHDDDLLQLAAAAPQAGGWWEALMQLPPTASPALQQAQRQLRDWAVAAATLPPHDLLDRILDEGDVSARYAAALPPARRRAGLQAIDALLAAALNVGGARYLTPYGFVRALRREALAMRLPAPDDAVRLLTVHGAKGLEAKWVFVMDSDPNRRQPDSASLLVDWPAEQRAPVRVAFVSGTRALAPSLKTLYEAEAAAQAREEINGLYVAMTRAEHGLVFSRSVPRSAVERSWWSRIVPLCEVWQPAPPPAAHGSGSGLEGPIRVIALPPWRRVEAGAPPALADPVGDRRSADIGRAVHRLLEWIGQPQQPLARAQWVSAAAAAAQAFNVASAAARVLEVATRIVESPACARFFSGPDLVWAGNEVPLVIAGEAQPLRLDRLVALREGGRRCWWVLDYKLGLQPAAVEGHRAQLARYVAAVQAVQVDDAVYGAFIAGDGTLVRLPM